MLRQRYKTRAIILRRKNYSEVDKILTVFTKDYGKLTLIAKGVRQIHSRRAPHLELFNEVELLLYHGKTMDYVLEAALVYSYQSIKRDLKRIAAAFTIAELVDSLCAERQELNTVYDLLRSSFGDLNRSSHYPSELVREVSHALLVQLGFVPAKHSWVSADSFRFIEGLIDRKLYSREFLRLLTETPKRR